MLTRRRFQEELAQQLAHSQRYGTPGAVLFLDLDDFGIAASIGIALIPEHGQTVEELLAHADAAMFQAKAAGNNHLRVYAPEGGLACG